MSDTKEKKTTKEPKDKRQQQYEDYQKIADEFFKKNANETRVYIANDKAMFLNDRMASNYVLTGPGQYCFSYLNMKHPAIIQKLKLDTKND